MKDVWNVWWTFVGPRSARTTVAAVLQYSEGSARALIGHRRRIHLNPESSHSWPQLQRISRRSHLFRHNIYMGAYRHQQQQLKQQERQRAAAADAWNRYLCIGPAMYPFIGRRSTLPAASSSYLDHHLHAQASAAGASMYSGIRLYSRIYAYTIICMYV